MIWFTMLFSACSAKIPDTESFYDRKLLCVKDAIGVRQRVVQKEFTRLTDNQKDTFRKMTGVICRANENLCSTRPDVCPV